MQFLTDSGIHDIESRQDDRTVRYTLSVPSAAPADGKRPLVLILHYAGTPTRFYGRPLLEHLLEPALRSLAPICLAPESIQGQWHNEANEAFVMKVLTGAIAAYAVAVDRVVICGYSMGAIGTWHFIRHYPEVFSAALPIAGFPSQTLACAVPVHAFHSANDELFPLARLQAAAAELRQTGTSIELTLADVQGHYDVNGYGTALAVAPTWLREIWRLRDAV